MPTINPILLKDSITIHREQTVQSETGFIDDCVEIYTDIPASLGCGEGQIDLFACLPKKRQGRDLCIEIGPGTDLGCFNMDLIVDVTRAGCPIGRYRVHDVLPIRLANGTLYSQYLVATQINGKNS